MAETRRSSILKPPKQRAPLQEVSALNIHHHDDCTATTFTQNIMRRVSFAGVSTVKEFDTRAESVLVCHTPAYEESFATSDSSVPSDHSSRFSSRSTISIGDQSTLPPYIDGASEDVVEAPKSQTQNLDPDDLMLKEFGVEPLSQKPKSPPRRRRFSIGFASEDDSPVPEEKPLPIPAISSASFYGSPSTKPRASAISSPRSGRVTINPFTLQTTASPKSQSKVNSPSQSKRNSPRSQPKVNSPRSQPKVNSPRSQPKLNSPRSQSKRNSPRSSRKSLAVGLPISKSPLAKALFDPNESCASSERLGEFPRTNIFAGTPSPSSESAGSASTPMSADRTVVCHDDMDLTRFDPRTPAWKNRTVYDNDMDMTRAIPTRIHSADDTRVQFADGQVQCSVQSSMTVEFSRPVSSVAISNEQHFVSGNGSRSVACVSRSNVTALPVASQPLTPAVPCAPLTENTRLVQPLNATVCDPQGMDFTQVNPVSSKEQDNLNCTLNESMGMDFTEAIACVPIVHDPNFSVPLPAVGHEVKMSNKTLNDSMGMDFTEAIPSAPVAQDLARSFSAEGYNRIISHEAKTPNKTLSDSVGMDFTAAIPSAPVAPDFGRSFSTEGSSRIVSYEAKTSNKTVNESMGMDFTEAISSAPVAQNFLRSFSAEEPNKTLSESVTMEFTKAVPVAQIFHENRLEHVSDSLGTCDSTLNRPDPSPATLNRPDPSHAAGFPSSQNTTVAEPTGMDFTKVSHTPLEISKSSDPISGDIYTPDSAIQPFSSSEGDAPRTDSSPAPLQRATDTFQQTGNLTINDHAAQPRDETISVPEAVPTSDASSTSAPEIAPVLLETPLVPRPSELLTPPKRQLSRKRSRDEIGNTAEDEELAVRRSRLMASPLLQATDVVIPSSRSPSPDRDDGTTRFPGLCQSFSAPKTPSVEPQTAPDTSKRPRENLCTSVASAEENPTPETHPTATVPASEGPQLNLCTSVVASAGETRTETHPIVDQSHLAVGTPPVAEAAPSTDTPLSSTSGGTQRDYLTPDEYKLTDISDKTKSASPALLHKSIMDVSIPSMVDISECERDLSSDARLYATLLEADNNVAVFHKEAEPVEIPPDESMRSEAEGTEKPSREEEKSARQEQLEECTKASETRDSVDRPHPTVIPQDSPRDTGLPVALRSHSTSYPAAEVSHRSFPVNRPVEEVLKEHRSQYRKRARCNYTVRKVEGSEWAFNYLEDSVELRIKVRESRFGGISGRDGQLVSLITDDLHGIWYIGGRLLHQKLSTEEWTSRIRETGDLLKLVEDVNLVANDVEVFMTHLAHLELLQKVEITHDWMCFDVLSKKSTDRWFKVKVDCRDLLNIKPQHVTIENIIGETREADIQNLVTCVKKNSSFLKNYVEVVKEYLQTIERVL